MYNVIILFDEPAARILMCRRRKPPYKGLLNLPGGKIEPLERGLDAAYRELYEECGVSRGDTTLTHVMDFTYHLSGVLLEVYAGRLRHETEVKGDENELLWVDLNQDFFDMKLFAGEGNIGHMLEIVRQNAEAIFGCLTN